MSIVNLGATTRVTADMAGRVLVEAETPTDPTDVTPPTVTLVSPVHGSTITTGSTDFIATATDDSGVIDHVRFFVDTVEVVRERVAPYGWGGADGVPEYDVTGLSNGSHVFTVIAVDAAGNLSAAASATVTITNPGGGGGGSGAPDTFGYIPPVPSGWEVREGGSISVSSTASNIYFRNATGSLWTSGSQHDIICVRGYHYGGVVGNSGSQYNMSHYGCVLGGLDSADGAQVKPSSFGSTRPANWLFQGCTWLDIVRVSNPSKHTDGIQFGGVLGAVLRFCYFKDVAVEHVLFNGWNGTPENGLLDRCYFGPRYSPGGRPVHFSNASGFVSTNLDAVDCYTNDASVTQIEAGAIGCSETGTQPLSAWPYGHPTTANKWGLGY